ncbi:MAG: hypothetical protein AB7O52_09100 [Planctomycetota bacterium]
MDTKELVAQLIANERMEANACWRLRPAAGRAPFALRLLGGKIVDLLHDNPPSLLEVAVFSSPSLRDKDQKKARRIAQAENRDPGAIVLEQQWVPPSEVPDLVLHAIELHFADLLASPRIDVEPGDASFEHAARPTISDYFQLQLSPTELIMAAARRMGRWDLIQEELSTLKDVYYATPKSMPYLQGSDQHPFEFAVLSQLDGQRDLGEVLDSSLVDPFAALEAVERLRADGCIDRINPVQLFQLGCDAEKSGDTRRARRLLERAEELGLDDFDIGFKLAEICERLGLRTLAIERFLAFAEKCVGQFRIEDTIRACRRIIQIDPDNLAIYERYVSLLARYGKGEEAVAEGLALAQRFEDRGEVDRARSTLEKIVEHAEGNEQILKRFLDQCQRSGHIDGVTRARRQLADLYHAREDYSHALESYQELFVAGEEGADVRSRLIELHFRAGNAARAMDHLAGLRRTAGWTTRDTVPEAREFFRRMAELDVANAAYTGWLVEDARARGDRHELGELLVQHCDRLEAGQFWPEAREAAEILFQLRPDDEVSARRLAQLERRCGRPSRAAAVLQSLLERVTTTTADPAKLRPLLEEILELDPLSGIARKVWREQATEVTQSPRLQLEEQLIELIGGQFGWIATLTDSVEESGTNRCVAFLAARLAELRGKSAEAITAYGWCGEAARKLGDLGLLAELVSRLERLDAENPRLSEWRHALRPPEPVTLPTPAVVTHDEPTSFASAASCADPEAKTEVIPPSRAPVIANSLARLRSLGSAAPTKAPTAGEEPVSPDAGNPNEVAATAERPFTESESGEVKVDNKGVMSSLARLKNLKGGPPSTASKPKPAGDAPPAIGSAASRLNALRSKPQQP